MVSFSKSFIICIITITSAVFFSDKNADAEQSQHIINKLLSSAIAIWHMNEEDGDIIVDSSGNENKAKAFETRIGDGILGKAKYFDGRNSYIETPLNRRIFHTGLTISLWIKPKGCLSSDLCTIIDSDHDEINNFVLQSTNKKADVFAWYAGKNVVLFNVPHNKWTHLILLMDIKNNKMRGYMDGRKMEVAGNNKFKLTDAFLTLGKRTSVDDRYYNGAIDEVIVWNYALKDAEIKRLLRTYNLSK